MVKLLTPLELRTIDEYLEEAGVRYDDIRNEMVDHVATALESMDGDFKDNFNLYMINNKRELLASNRAFKKLARNKAFRILKRNFLRPQLWTVVLSLFTLSLISGNRDMEDMAANLQITLLVVSSALYLYFWFYKIISRNNYSVINRLVTYIYSGSIVFRADMLIDNKVALLLYYSFSITFFLFLMQSLWALNKTYKMQYHG
jgi:hypothetical protein